MSIRRHTITNIAGAVIPMFVMLVTVPLYLKTLGDVRYGVLALVWLMLGYFSFMEMGLGKATANHIARLHDAPDRERGTIFWTALLVNAALGLVAAFILWNIGEYLLSSVLKIPKEFQSEAQESLPWIIATLPLVLVSSVLNGALEGRKQFFIVNVLQVTSSAIFQVVPLVVAYIYGPSLSYVIPAAVLSRALMNIPFLIACYVYVPLAPRPVLSASAARSLFSFGGWVAVTGMVSPLLDTIDRFLIGIVLGAQAVTHYVIPMQLVGKVKIIPGSLSRALFPRFSADAPADADRLALNAMRTLTIVMTPIVICGIVLLRPFMQIWVGDEIAAIAAPLGEILFFGVWINSLAHIPYFLLQGKGRPDIVAKTHAIEIAPFIFIIWIAMQQWGLYGAAAAWSARVTIEAGLLFLFSGMKKESLHIISGPCVMILFAIVVAHNIDNQDWIWRAGFAMVFFIWSVIWLKKSGGYVELSRTILNRHLTLRSRE